MKNISCFLLLLFVSCTKPVQITKAISLEDRVSYIANEHSGDTLPHLYNHQLEKAGLLKNGRAVENRFSGFPKNIVLKGSGLHTLTLTVKENYNEGNIKIFSSQSTDTITVGLDSYMPSFCQADVIPGGYDELVIYQEGYIMNGTNYSVEVYEVK